MIWLFLFRIRVTCSDAEIKHESDLTWKWMLGTEWLQSFDATGGGTTGSQSVAFKNCTNRVGYLHPISTSVDPWTHTLCGPPAAVTATVCGARSSGDGRCVSAFLMLNETLINPQSHNVSAHIIMIYNRWSWRGGRLVWEPWLNLCFLQMMWFC